MNGESTKTSRKGSNPYDDANFVSKYLYLWLKDLFKMGLSKELQEEDIYVCSKNQKSSKVAKNFELLWAEELKKDKPSLIKVTLSVFWYNVMTVGFLFSIVDMACKLTNPLLLGLLIGFFTHNSNNFTTNDGYLIATGIALTLLTPILLFHPFMFFLFKTAMKLRISCCSLIYSKILTFSKFTMRDGIAGQAINLMSNDVNRFDWLMSFTHDIWRAPLGSAIAGYFIFAQVGYAGLLGMAILVFIMPFQAWLGKKAANFRLQTALRTDKRVDLMYSIINGVQVVKMYGWENAYERAIRSIRSHEIQAIAKTFYIKATLLSCEILTSFAVFATLVTYVYMGNSITAEKAFVTIAYFNYVNLVLVHFWPMAITSVAEGWISLKRVESFLIQKTQSHDTIQDNQYSGASKSGIVLKNASAYWNQEEKNKIGVSSINLEIGNQNLTAIVGQVGCGKTTLLEVILKELPLVEGSLEINGSISYAAQAAWIFEGSVKSNIVFIEEFDESRYNKVVSVCALERDLELFPHGDETVVGDRGISLSGGQKARINLARAIYKKAHIYLLDDPLSAVDANVGKHIFEKCIREFLGDKICVLVTHQLQYLKDVEHLVVMDKGKIKSQNSLDVLQSQENLSEISIFSEIAATDDDANIKIRQRKQSEVPRATNADKDDEKVTKETQKMGKVSSDIYMNYLKSVKSSLVVVFVALLFIVTQAIHSGVDFFVSIWVNWEERYGSQQVSTVENISIWDGEWWTTDRHVYLYSILIGLLMFLAVIRSFSFYNMCLRISKNLHDKLYYGVTRATMVFFHQNSTGRILNRFSKDLGSIDSMLPVIIADCIEFFLELAGIITIVAIINYWLLIPTFVVSIMFYALRSVFLTTARNVKRVEAITRSPMFTHTTASIEGLSTIRAFRAEHLLRREFDGHQDANTSAWFLFVATSRGFAFWLDFFCVVYVICVIYSFLVLGSDVIGANVGLAITQAINLIGIANYGLRQTAELENQMTSVERIIEYSNLPSERSLEDRETMKKLPEIWPQRGLIKFNNVSVKYSAGGNFVLRNLNFETRHNEKIGVVGRTGAGKSSIIQALFNLSIVEGTIEIDDVDISTLGLHTFRTKMSIIPQDPTLFVGTLRSNLDPFNEKSDDEIWNALSQVQLKNAVEELAGGIETKVADGGFNFSTGQRQLFCLARAILKRNKILILDEATANVDTETDELIQATIRAQFSDCNVLTVAHRINTILDSDRIMVLDAGRIIEFDTPRNLYKTGGAFRKLVDEAGLNLDVVKADKKDD